MNQFVQPINVLKIHHRFLFAGRWLWIKTTINRILHNLINTTTTTTTAVIIIISSSSSSRNINIIIIIIIIIVIIIIIFFNGIP